MSRKSFSLYKDVLPVMVMVGIECSDTGLATLFKAATLRGMSNHVFVAYAYAIATVVLLPSIFISKRSSSQILGYAGISYSSPTLASSIGNLAPAFTFLLAVIFRMEKVAAKSRSSQAKVIGSIVSIAGAFVLTFYKGPSINSAQTHVTLSLRQQKLRILNSVDSSWAIAGIMLTADYLLVSLWYILEGIFGKFMSNTVYAWALHLKGPVYVASFKPLTIVIAVAMGVMFLGDTLHIGSIIGATIISIGLYTVLWGKATEETEEDVVGSQESPTSENGPLLHSFKIVNSEKKIHANV